MRLSDHDASFIYSETASTPMHGAGIAVVDGELDHESVRDHIESRLHRIPRYRQRLVFVPFNLAHPKWVDDPNFDITNHVRHHEVPSSATLEDALATCLELSEPLLPRDRPLWCIYVLTGIPGKTILLQLAHHAMVDGASGVDISLVLFDLQQNPEAETETPPEWDPAPLPDPLTVATEAVRETTERLTQQNLRLNDLSGPKGELLRRAAESMTRFVAEPVITAPWNRGPVGPKRQLCWRKVSFADVRRIRNQLGGTVNDVVLAIVVEAAARYVSTAGTTTGGQHFRVMCPVNVRREDERGALGNRVSGIFPLFDAAPMPMTERLDAVRWETESIKQNREAQALQLMTEVIPPAPPIAMMGSQLVGTQFDLTAPAAQFPLPLLPSFGPRLPMAGFNFTCTNVPGVQTTQYLLGQAVEHNFAVLMLGGNLGYGTAIMSYNQNLYFNLVSDPRLLEDLDRMADYIDETFEELKAAAGIEAAA